MKKRFIVKAIALLFIVTLFGILFIALRRESVIPPTIRQQANFVIFYPASNQVQIQKTSFKYDNSLKLLSFVVHFKGRDITFAEQNSPDSFTDDPNFYTQFVSKLNGYAKFDSINGRVDLVQPTEIKSEAGVLNAKGTLMIARSSGNLSEDEWKFLFNSLSISNVH